MKIGLLVLAALLLVPSGQGAAAASLAHYIEEALAHNDELAGARAAELAAAHGVRKNGVLPDPVLAVQYYLQSVETRTGPQEAAIGINQQLPWPGKLALAKEQARRQQGVLARRLEAVELGVIRQVKEAYVEYGYNSAARRITRQGLELLRYSESVALNRYSTGKLDLDKVLRLQVEVVLLEERLQGLVDRQDVLRTRLNGLLGAPRQTKRQAPATLPVVGLAMPEAELYELARRKSPRLAEADTVIAREKVAVAQAEKDFWPDLTVSLKTIVTGSAEFGDPPDSGRDPVIAGLTLNIPLFRDKRHGAVAEQRHEVLAARSRRAQLVQELDGAIEQVLAKYRSSRRRHDFYEQSVLPKLRQEVEVGLQSFQDGSQGALALLAAEKELLRFELEQSRARADQAIAVARLEELAGVTLAQWQAVPLGEEVPAEHQLQ